MDRCDAGQGPSLGVRREVKRGHSGVFENDEKDGKACSLATTTPLSIGSASWANRGEGLLWQLWSDGTPPSLEAMLA